MRTSGGPKDKRTMGSGGQGPGDRRRPEEKKQTDRRIEKMNKQSPPPPQKANQRTLTKAGTLWNPRGYWEHGGPWGVRGAPRCSQGLHGAPKGLQKLLGIRINVPWGSKGLVGSPVAQGALRALQCSYTFPGAFLTCPISSKYRDA